MISIRQNTVERFEMDDDGESFIGNNRYWHQVNDRNTFLENPIWGVVKDDTVWGSNIYAIFARFGLLGSMFYYLLVLYFISLILVADNNVKKLYYKIVIVILFNLFHRPEFSAAFITIIIYTMVNKLECIIQQPHQEEQGIKQLA